jgi:hypothetical protein
MTEQEIGHIAAIGHLVDGRWHQAARGLEDVTIAQPLDMLALQVGYQLDFLTGQSRMLRDRIARAWPAWSRQTPGWHTLLVMHAFGRRRRAITPRPKPPDAKPSRLSVATPGHSTRWPM